MSLARFGLPTVARLQQLSKLRASLFETTFNPDSLRTGSKVLKARLRGPAMLRYYGERISGWAGLNAAVPNLELKDVAEETRLIDLETRRKRGKGEFSRGPTDWDRDWRADGVMVVILCSYTQEGSRASCFDEEEVIARLPTSWLSTLRIHFLQHTLPPPLLTSFYHCTLQSRL